MTSILRRRKGSTYVNEIENANVNDPVAFWDFIKKLSPRKKSEILWEMLGTDGEIVTNMGDVLDIWSKEFNDLLTPPAPSAEMQEHIQNIMLINRQNERVDVIENLQFNTDFTMSEVGKLVDKAKANKAPGLDGIVYDILKNQVAIRVLTYLFNFCFTNNLIPSVWKKGLINPIPKGGVSDPRTPLSYRGISLLPVIAKLYTAGLSKRISKHLESNRILVNKQTGFRPDSRV